MSQLRSQIWGLDPTFSLENVRELQKESKRYYEPIEYLIGRDDLKLDETDRLLLQRWVIEGPIQTYEIEGERKTTIRYYTARGIFESPASENDAFADENRKMILARYRRVDEKVSNVIFLELHGRVYAIVYGTSSAFQVRTILMGQGFKQRRRTEWGRIQTQLAQYRLDNDFFYWMFKKRNQSISTLFGDIEVTDIEGIGRYSDRQQHKTRGTGPNSTDELSNKTALGVSQLVYESDFNLNYEWFDIHTSLEEFSESIVDLKRSIMTDPVTGEAGPITGNETIFFLKLYLEIIPGLVSAYNREVSKGLWTQTLATKTKRGWALEVIQELIQYHNISRNEILQIKAFPKISRFKRRP